LVNAVPRQLMQPRLVAEVQRQADIGLGFGGLPRIAAANPVYALNAYCLCGAYLVGRLTSYKIVINLFAEAVP
jgi:hypothetical protein